MISSLIIVTTDHVQGRGQGGEHGEQIGMKKKHLVMVMVMFIMVMFTVEVWIFLEENEISCERHWQ